MTSKPKKKSSPRKPRGFPPEKAAELYRRLAEDRPNPKTELVFHSPFTLLVAVVLSAQSTDAGVNKATPGLFKAADTPAKMAKLSVAQVASHIKTIGFWRTKAKNVVALSKMLVEQHGGEAPHDRAALEALPGVGRKTANVMLREIWGEETIAVDTHVFRVANRTGLALGPTPEKVEASFAVMGVDSQLIADGTYFILEEDGVLAGCGGWSRRATLFGGDHSAGRDAALLDPKVDAARVRAMYTHPDHTRKGVGRIVLDACEAAARAEGFATVEMAATMGGVPLYRACGYHDIEPFEAVTSNGYRVPLIRMGKSL